MAKNQYISHDISNEQQEMQVHSQKSSRSSVSCGSSMTDDDNTPLLQQASDFNQQADNPELDDEQTSGCSAQQMQQLQQASERKQ